MNTSKAKSTNQKYFKRKNSTSIELGSIDSEFDQNNISLKNLVKMRCKLILLKMRIVRVQCAFNKTMVQCIQKDELIQKLNIRYSKSNNYMQNRSQYIYYFFIRPYGMKFLSILTGLFSVLIVISEFSRFIHKDLNMLRLLIIKETNYFLSFTLTFPRLLYTCICTYYGLFRFKLFNIYQMQFESTDEISLIYSATMLARLIHDYNFLFVLDLKDTNFEEIMTILNDFTLLSQVIDLYVFPILIVVVCVCTMFRIVTCILSCIGLSRFQFDRHETELRIEEGRIIVNEKRDSDLSFLKEHHENEISKLLEKSEDLEQSNCENINRTAKYKGDSLLYSDSLIYSLHTSKAKSGFAENMIKDSLENDCKASLSGSNYNTSLKRQDSPPKMSQITVDIAEEDNNCDSVEDSKVIYLSPKHGIFKEI